VWFSENFESGSASSWILAAVGGDSIAGCVSPRRAVLADRFRVIDTHMSAARRPLMYAAGDAGGAAVMVLGDTAWALVLDGPTFIIEARVAPYDTYAHASSKHLYLVERYVDNSKFAYGGLKSPGSGQSHRAGQRTAGTFNRQSTSPDGAAESLGPGRLDGRSVGTERAGAWFTLRDEIVAGAVSALLHRLHRLARPVLHERKNRHEPTMPPSSRAAGRVTPTTKSFMIDDIKTADPPTIVLSREPDLERHRRLQAPTSSTSRTQVDAVSATPSPSASSAPGIVFGRAQRQSGDAHAGASARPALRSRAARTRLVTKSSAPPSRLDPARGVP